MELGEYYTKDREGAASYGEQVQTSLLSGIEKRLQGENTLSTDFTWLCFQQSPVDVERDRVIAGRFDLLKDVEPKVRDRHSAQGISDQAATQVKE